MELPAFHDHPLLRELTAEQAASLATCACEVTFDEGAFICREGGDADTLYLLRSGRVVMEQHVPGRGVAQVESLSGGDILGLSWLFAGTRWTLDARAVAPVQAFALDADCVRQRMDDDPALGFGLLRHIVRAFYDRLLRVRLQRLDVYKSGS